MCLGMFLMPCRVSNSSLQASLLLYACGIYLLSFCIVSQFVHQFLHTFRCTFADVSNTLCRVLHRRIGIYQINRHSRTYISHQSGGGIHVERCAYDDEDIGLFRLFSSGFYHGYGFSEEHNERAKQRTVAGTCTGCHLSMVFRQLCNVLLIVRITT